jgi:hypothetical protein
LISSLAFLAEAFRAAVRAAQTTKSASFRAGRLPWWSILADRLVLILEGRELRFRLRKLLPLPFNGEILALLPDGPGVIAWVRSADGERRVFLLDFLRREAREM